MPTRNSNEDSLRKEFEKERRRQIGSVIWERLREDGKVQEAIDGKANGHAKWQEEFEADVIREEQYAEDLRKGGRESDGPTIKQGGLPDDHRQRAWRKITKLEAANRPDVRAFRKEVLRGRLIKAEQIPKWMERQKTRQGKPTTLSRLELGPNDVPIVPDGGIRNFERVVLKYDDPGNRFTHSVLVNIHSSLGRLKRLADRLHKEYGWDEGDAVAFILAERLPVGTLLRYSTSLNAAPRMSRMSRIVLDVTHNTPWKTVQKLYSLAQKQMPPTGRALSKKHAELAVFAARANDGRTWVQAMKDYNQSHRSTAYHDSSDFRRQALDAYRRVMNMDLSWASTRRQAD